MRAEKTVGNVKHEYYYVDGLLKTEKIGDDYEMYYRYDTNGVLASVTRYTVSTDASSILYAQTNTRGDVISLYDGNGATRVKYVYDSWGKLISATDGNGNALAETAIGSLNSIRYRGYVYDSETGLYYLQSRYYDPEVGRFINADSVDCIGYSGETLSYNMFAYCENNGVNNEDSTGLVGSFINNTINNFIKNIFDLLFSAFTVKYDVPLYSQGNSSLCWAYCQVMVEDYKANVVKSQAEADLRAKEIAIGQHGEDDWNTRGWPTNCARYNLFGQPIPEFIDISSISELYWLLKNHGPVYAVYRESKKVSHMVVVTGVNLLKDIVYTNNPWDVQGEQKFAQYLRGFAGGKGDGSYPLEVYYTTK